MATRLLGVVNALVLVRLLVPADIGVVALGYSFVSSLDQFCTVDIKDAIIRDDRGDRELFDTGFTLNLLRALLMGAALAIGAGPIAHFFGDPRLKGIVLVFAAMTAFTGLTNIGTIEFRRHIAFDKEFIPQVVPRIFSVAIALTAGILLRSYWALVVGIASVTVLGVIFSYWMHPDRPRLALGAWRRVAGFSLWMWVVGLITLARTQAPILIIGRLIGPAAVGIFSIGSEVANFPATELVMPLSRASFSGFAAVRRSGDSGGSAFLRILGAMVLITLPAGTGISAVAYPVVELAFGPAWMKAVPLAQILGLSGMLGLFGWISATLFAAHAWLRPMAKMSGAATIVCALAVALRPHRGRYRRRDHRCVRPAGPPPRNASAPRASPRRSPRPRVAEPDRDRDYGARSHLAPSGLGGLLRRGMGARRPAVGHGRHRHPGICHCSARALDRGGATAGSRNRPARRCRADDEAGSSHMPARLRRRVKRLANSDELGWDGLHASRGYSP